MILLSKNKRSYRKSRPKNKDKIVNKKNRYKEEEEKPKIIKKYTSLQKIPKQAETIAKNKEQQQLIDAIESCQIVFCTGAAGTGKTYVSLRKGIEAVLLRKVEKFIQIRPAVPAGENLGHLPGTLQEKLDPYHQPIRSILKEFGRNINVDALYEQNRIEILAIAYVRGYTFSNSYVLVTEAQNVSPEQMKMILTRIGEKCTMVIEGDYSQNDLKHNTSGLTDAVDRFKDIQDDDIKVIELKDIVRNPLINKILRAYD